MSAADAAAQPTRAKIPPPSAPHPHRWMGGERYGGRLTKAMRLRTLKALIELDGPFCRYAGCPRLGEAEGVSTDERLRSAFEVNHVADPADHWLDVMELTHPDCNKRARYDPAEEARRVEARARLQRLGRENSGAPAPADPRALDPMDATARLHEEVDYRSGSPEMQSNDRAEPDWEAWFFAHLASLGRMTKYEAINAGAHEAGCSPTAARKHYEKRVWVPGKMVGEHPELALWEYAGSFRDSEGREHKGKMVAPRPGWEMRLDGAPGAGSRWVPRRRGDAGA